MDHLEYGLLLFFNPIRDSASNVSPYSLGLWFRHCPSGKVKERNNRTVKLIEDRGRKDLA